MIRRGFADTAEGQIHYREQGPTSPPSPLSNRRGRDEPMVLLHEVARSSDGFSEVMPILAERRRVIAMDLPGYGDSYHPAAYPGMAGYARAVIDFIDALGIDRIVLLGFHTGSAVAAEVAALYPDRIARLIVCGLPDARPEIRAKRMAELHPTPPDSEFQFMIDLARSLPPFAEKYWGVEYAARYGLDFQKAMPNTHWGHQAVYEQDVRARIPQITASTLLFCARNDVFVDLQPELAALFPNVRTAVIAESEKFPLVNAPVQSCALIEAFLAS